MESQFGKAKTIMLKHFPFLKGCIRDFHFEENHSKESLQKYFGFYFFFMTHIPEQLSGPDVDDFVANIAEFRRLHADQGLESEQCDTQCGVINGQYELEMKSYIDRFPILELLFKGCNSHAIFHERLMYVFMFVQLLNNIKQKPKYLETILMIPKTGLEPIGYFLDKTGCTDLTVDQKKYIGFEVKKAIKAPETIKRFNLRKFYIDQELIVSIHYEPQYHQNIKLFMTGIKTGIYVQQQQPYRGLMDE